MKDAILAEKLRIHQLAKELNVDSKAILTKCSAEGVEVKNHMSTVLVGLAATIREWFSESTMTSATESTKRVDLKKVRRKKPAAKKAKEKKSPEQASEVMAVPTTAVAEVHGKAKTNDVIAAKTEKAPKSRVAERKSKATQEKLEKPPTVQPAPEKISPPKDKPPEVISPPAEPIKAAGPQHVPEPVQLKGPRVIRVEAPEPIRPPPHRSPPPAQRFRHTGLSDRSAGAAADAAPPDTVRKSRSRSTPQTESEKTALKKKRTTGRRGGGRGSDAGDLIKEWRDRDLEERQEKLRGATGRRAKRRASVSHGSSAHRAITSAQVSEPIILKEFCAATGLALAQLTSHFINELKILPNINMILERKVAELLATEFGIELTVVAAKSPLDEFRDEYKALERPGLTVRPPIVTFLGHVDHGKTSLLDTIRHSRVTAGEAGGITQHVGSYHLQRDGLSVTFLDTPGHKAFTAMRARGAQMTDVVVLVVAADDGVMPQTIEAINHARAADVPIVVALNKIDLPGIDLNKVYGQLAEHDLAPTDWGGTTDVIKTSATDGTGIDELIEHLSTLSELLELKGDPTIPCYGRVIEAEMKPGVGVVSRILILDGTLRTGDFIACGPGFGKVRIMKNDQGEVLHEAGLSLPVEVSGLDRLPDAGDELYQVESLRRAEEIAEEAKQQRRRDSLSVFKKPKTLEDLFGQSQAGAIPELNVIVKADAQGSVDVLRKTLGEFPADQVKLTILHAGVGGIVESDVLLAEASGAIVIGFHVIPDNHVKRLADSRGVDIRLYRVIYHLMDDIKKALEGLLAPEEKFEQRGIAEVRDIFKVSKTGTVAGCFVREGVFARNYSVRVVRDSVVVRDKATIASLRRFKEDVKEVKAGFECGIKIEGFDDIKPNDIIEGFEIVKIARSL